MQAQYLSLLFSLIAVGVAVYGIYERRLAATRSEQIRFSVIVSDLEKLKLELASEREPIGNRIEALHGSMELLVQQGLSLLRQHEVVANSTELRTFAYVLEEIGLTDDSETLWLQAIDKAQSESDIQTLFAARAYGYHLLRQGRTEEARQRLSSAASEISPTDDQGRYWLAETLSSWAYWEDPDTASNLLEQIRALHHACRSPTVSMRIGKLYSDSPSVPGDGN